MRILLFDDSTPIQKVIRLGLRNRPETELRVSETLEDAQVAVREFQPDLIIGSETVAGQQSGQVYQNLLGDTGRVIILTHNQDSETQLARQGYVHILRKPFQLSELRGLLDKIVPRKASTTWEKMPTLASADRQPHDEDVSESTDSAEFSEGLGEDDTALMRIDFDHQVTELESAFRDTLRVFKDTTPDREENAHKSPQDTADLPPNGSCDGAELGHPALTMDVSRLEEALKESTHSEARIISTDLPAPKHSQSAPTTQPVPLPPGAAQTQKAQALEALRATQSTTSITRADPDFVKQLEDVRVHNTPNRDPTDAEREARQEEATPKALLSSTHSQRIELEKTIHQILDSRLHHEFRSFEMQAENRILADLENRMFSQLEHRVNPAVDKYLNTHWQALVRSVTAQARKAVDVDTTQKIETQMHGMQKRLTLDLKTELRTEVKEALQNWMGHYSRDILKEVAREELQKLIESI